VISERPNGGADPAVLTTLGIDPRQKTAVAIKSQVFGPKSYGDIVDDVIVVDGEGWATSNFSRLPYRRLRRPIFPLDPEVGFA
jgi:microcystin degradation protein MlrC